MDEDVRLGPMDGLFYTNPTPKAWIAEGKGGKNV
jgi:hypothetical protein